MSRVIHFGLTSPTAKYRELDREMEFLLGGSPFIVHMSFTAWGETFPQDDEGMDALHVLLYFDDDEEPLSAERVAAARAALHALIERSGCRLVDYCIEDDGKTWGEDTHTHGLWALESTNGRPDGHGFKSRRATGEI